MDHLKINGVDVELRSTVETSAEVSTTAEETRVELHLKPLKPNCFVTNVDGSELTITEVNHEGIADAHRSVLD